MTVSHVRLLCIINMQLKTIWRESVQGGLPSSASPPTGRRDRLRGFGGGNQRAGPTRGDGEDARKPPFVVATTSPLAHQNAGDFKRVCQRDIHGDGSPASVSAVRVCSLEGSFLVELARSKMPTAVIVGRPGALRFILNRQLTY